MALINKTYFFAELAIAQLSDPSVTAAINAVIDEREPELLQRLLGLELYEAYKAGIDGDVQKYTDIKDGKTYTHPSTGKKEQWHGLAFTLGTAKKSLIANYVYWHYIRDNHTFTTGSGQKKTESGINALPTDKLVRAWNEMVKWSTELYIFLSAFPALYPEFANTVIDAELYTMQNSLGI